MQIVAVTDPLMLGFLRKAMVGIRVEGDVRIAADTIGALPRGRLRGDHGRLVRPDRRDRRARTTTACSQLLNDKIRAVPGVASTETFIYLKICKQTYPWGTR